MRDFRRDAGWNAVAHRAVGGRDLRAQARIAVEARDPAGEISSAVRDDRVPGKVLAQPGDDLGELNPARVRGGFRPFEIVGARLLAPGAPRGTVQLHAFQRGRDLRHAGIDQQLALVDPAELLVARVHVHELLLRPRRLDERVGAGRHLAQARADHEQQIRAAHALGELGVDADADVADVMAVAVVEQVLEAERAGDREARAFRERLQVAAGFARPNRASQYRERAFRAREQASQLFQITGGRTRLHHLVGRDIGHARRLGEHVLGQREHHRPGPSRHRQVKGAAHVLVHAVGALDLRDPLRHRPEHPAIVHLLEALAVGELPGNLADEQDHRRRILLGGVHADRGVGRSGTARDETDPGAPGDLGPRLGHVSSAAVLARNDQADRFARVVEGIEHREIALAGNAERGVDAVDFQRIDENLCRGPECAGSRHGLQLYLSDAAPGPIG